VRVTARSLAQGVKAEAYRLGFSLAGITSPDPPPHLAVFERWLAEGRAGEMAYLESERARQRRADPRTILPECRSILVLAVPYWPPQRALDNPAAQVETSGAGRVAAYAWGDDYHEVLPERLKALVDYLEAEVGQPIPNRWYTDTGPLLERDLAQRAGLGWIGKNTCLIHPQLGSYFLLAEILLGIDLEADLPFAADHCGACTRCLEACPTGCILPDRTLDARRCLSYLTIELKGPIPAELRPQVGDWIFGCDVCQAVCPWNERFAPSTGDPAFAPRPDLPRPDLISELRLEPASFNRKFKKSPVQRARRRGYLRNAAVALGNLQAGSGNPAAAAALAHSLQADPEPLVRLHAAWALGRLGGEIAGRALSAAVQQEADPAVLSEILAAQQAAGAG
jgi:epoxyqueuosine reductase